MTDISQSIVINALPEKVFDVVTDPYLVIPLMPGLRSVSDVNVPLQNGSSFRWRYQLLGLTFRGTWLVETIRRPSTYISTTTGGIVSRWTYTLVPKETTTYLTLDIEFGAPESIIKRYALSFIEPHTRKLAETYLHTLKTFFEESPRKDAL